MVASNDYKPANAERLSRRMMRRASSFVQAKGATKPAGLSNTPSRFHGIGRTLQ
jgi:hypothetical protein